MEGNRHGMITGSIIHQVYTKVNALQLNKGVPGVNATKLPLNCGNSKGSDSQKDEHPTIIKVKKDEHPTIIKVKKDEHPTIIKVKKDEHPTIIRVNIEAHSSSWR